MQPPMSLRSRSGSRRAIIAIGAIAMVAIGAGGAAASPADGASGTPGTVANGTPVVTPALSAEQGVVPPTEVSWGECPPDVVAGTAPYVLQCASVPVPLDYTDPEGTKIEIMVSRLASPEPAARRGILMLNPGGPGGRGWRSRRPWSKGGCPSA